MALHLMCGSQHASRRKVYYLPAVQIYETRFHTQPGVSEVGKSNKYG